MTTEEMLRRVLVKCKSDFCDVLIETTLPVAKRAAGVLCDECRREARRIQNRDYYWRRGKRLRKQPGERLERIREYDRERKRAKARGER